MRYIFLLFVLVLSIPIFGQQKTFVGTNLSSLVFQSLNIQYQQNIYPNLSLQFEVGARFQSRSLEEPLRFTALEGYVQPKNHAVGLAVSARFSNQHEREIDYPYVGIGLAGAYYNETLETESVSVPGTIDDKGFKLGGFLIIGYVITLADRLSLDLGLQVGYAEPREETLAYYLPGMGFTTFGLSYLGIKGGHLNPVITLKYKLVKDKRERIKEM